MSSNANRNTAVRRDGYVEVQKHEKPPVHILIDYDLTASRRPTRDRHVAEFKTQMAGLQKAVGMNPEDKLLISLAVHNGDGARYICSETDPVKVGEALERIACVSSETQIIGSMNDAMGRLQAQGRKPDAIIHIGDTTDGGRFPGGDNSDNLIAAAKRYGVPVITLLEETKGESGTKPHHKEAMAAMSEASGIVGCPLPYSAEIKFADMFLVIAATIKHKNDPNMMQKVLAGVSERVRNIFTNIIRESIARPHTVTEPPVKIQVRPVIERPPVAAQTPARRPYGKLALGLIALVGLASLALCGRDNTKTEVAPPAPVATPVEPPKDVLKGDVVIISDRDRVLFETGKADLTPDFKTYLDGLAQKLNANPGKCTLFDVAGYTDPRGTAEYNMDLSVRRAAAVGRYLVEQGVPTRQIRTMGFGLTKQLPPSRPGMTVDEVYQEARRVSFTCRDPVSP